MAYMGGPEMAPHTPNADSAANRQSDAPPMLRYFSPR